MTYPSSILINGKVFVAKARFPLHNFVGYFCEESQQEVKVRFSEFYRHFEIEGSSRAGHLNPYAVWRESLQGDIFMEESMIPVYLTAEQDKALDKAITQVLVDVFKS